ncbi:hypothetical protein ACH5RR_014982 [Cinchona calisaya]|uniref:NB-ARC domain-containing protein n=1 Tax=Cinchona calisaya TaxID=153742 RepID=A0ABD2ZS92_9GENT
MAGEEIEKYLLDKLDQAIKETESTEQYLSTCFFDLHSDFKKLKESLETDSRSNQARSGQRRENVYYLNNLLTEWQLISKSQSVYSPEALVLTYKLSKSLKKIRKDLRGGEGSRVPDKTSLQNTPTDANINLPKNLATYRWSSRAVDPSKVYGFDDKERFLERIVVRKESKNGFKAFAIVGMPGVGKTTLCQLIFNNKQVKAHFLPRIWVCLSKQPEDDQDNRKEIVKRMLTCLGVDDEIIEKAAEDQSLQKLMFALRIQLMGKKYLIVLDDAWNSCFGGLFSEPKKDDKSFYGKFSYGLPKGHGGTVIITTRSEEIAKNMVGEENLHQLPVLQDKESCWKIFKDTVEKDDVQFPDKLMPLKDLIVDKSAGLPLAAKMMGEIMHQKLLDK